MACALTGCPLIKMVCLIWGGCSSGMGTLCGRTRGRSVALPSGWIGMTFIMAPRYNWLNGSQGLTTAPRQREAVKACLLAFGHGLEPGRGWFGPAPAAYNLIAWTPNKAQGYRKDMHQSGKGNGGKNNQAQNNM